jgi:hypothetical protein
MKGYLKIVEAFAKYFHRSPDQLGPEQMRAYHVHGRNDSHFLGGLGLTAQLGSVEYSRPRRFRNAKQWPAQVRTVWPECPAEISADGWYLRLARATAVLPTG